MCTTFSNDLISTDAIEHGIKGTAALGMSLLVLHAVFGEGATDAGGRMSKVSAEVQRKSFHMIGGAIISATFQWGLKWGYFSSTYHAVATETRANVALQEPLDVGVAFISVCFVVWLIEAARLHIPVVKQWCFKSFKGLIREKEFNKASGIAYFIPGVLAAMLAAPPNVAILGILFLSVGDAAASLGSAAGCIPIGTSTRKVEGSIGCFVVCAAMSVGLGLATDVALTASALVTFGEVLAEVIGLDDNLVIPMMGVLGVRVGLNPQFAAMGVVMGFGLGTTVSLGMLVGATTPNGAIKQ